MVNDLTKTVFGKNLHRTVTIAEAITLFHEMSLFSIGELAERAISKKSKIAQCGKNNPNSDLINGLEIKHGMTHPKNPRGKTLTAYLSKDGKTSHMLGVVTEQVTGKQYFFSIPYSAYKKADANTLAIPFELDGTPRRVPKRATYLPNGWDYEVKSFGELCKIAKSH
jgi:hypothetical protein